MFLLQIGLMFCRSSCDAKTIWPQPKRLFKKKKSNIFVKTFSAPPHRYNPLNQFTCKYLYHLSDCLFDYFITSVY